MKRDDELTPAELDELTRLLDLGDRFRRVARVYALALAVSAAACAIAIVKGLPTLEILACVNALFAGVGYYRAAFIHFPRTHREAGRILGATE